MIIKNYFHKKGFALGLILKQRLAASRKWPFHWLKQVAAGGQSKGTHVREPYLLQVPVFAQVFVLSLEAFHLLLCLPDAKPVQSRSLLPKDRECFDQ